MHYFYNKRLIHPSNMQMPITKVRDSKTIILLLCHQKLRALSGRDKEIGREQMSWGRDIWGQSVQQKAVAIRPMCRVQLSAFVYSNNVLCLWKSVVSWSLGVLSSYKCFRGGDLRTEMIHFTGGWVRRPQALGLGLCNSWAEKCSESVSESFLRLQRQ